MPVTTPLGRLRDDGDGARLEFERRYDEPIDEVWSALTEPDRTARWFGRWSGDPASGRVELQMTAEAGAPTETVVIVACDPPRRIEVDMAGPDGTWRLAVELEAVEGGTVLRFAHRLGAPDDPASVGPGWHFYLDRLGAVLSGEPVPDAFADYHPALAAAYAR